MPGEKKYEDSGLKSLPAPDGTSISAHFTAESLAASASPRKSKKSKAKKLSTKELAAKERQREREQRMEELQAADKINKERLEKIRESLRKRKENTTPKVSTFRKDRVQKRVVWKDGMKTQTNRNRKMLEEVFLFVKDTPAARESSSPTAALAMEENDFMAIEEDMEHAH